MTTQLHWLLLATAAAAACMTWIFRRLAIRRGLLDVPNWRSSHTVPTPRGGGVSIVLATLLAIPALAVVGLAVPAREFLVMATFGGAVALVGYLDDHGHVPATIRLLVHVVAIGGTLLLLPTIALGVRELSESVPVWVWIALATLAGTWFLNLFNFMDGIDGIAASQAIFMSVAAAMLAAAATAPAHLVALWLVVAAASTGFLIWNWAPARIFMGDAGSGFLGFVIAVLLIQSIAVEALSVWTALTLGAAFITDASMTLLRRMLRGERWYTAHRSHAYQWLARRWGSHALVALLFLSINMLIVLPIAWWTMLVPAHAAPVSLGLLTTMSVAWILLGAGRAEVASIDMA